MKTNTYDFQYGSEWVLIRKRAKKHYAYTCQECNKTFGSYDLDVHHIVSISHFINQGYVLPGPEHRCFGIKTRRYWHVKVNLIVLCMRCHSECHHPHLQELYKKLEFKRSKQNVSR